MTERDDELPPADGAPAPDAEARLEALFALGSTPPASLDARIAARRAAGDRVILPVPGDPEAPAATPARPHRWRHALALAGVAVAAAAALLLLRTDRTSEDAVITTPPVARVDTPGVVPSPDSARRDTAPTPAAPGGGGRTDRFPTASPDVTVGLGGGRPVEVEPFSARLLEYAEDVVDSAAVVATSRETMRAVVTWPAGDSALAALGARIRARLVERGVPAARVTAGADPLSPAGVVRLTVVRTPR